MASDAIIATLILAAMCVAMYLLARLAKRRMGIGSGVVAQNALRIVGKRPLDQKSALRVIEIAGGRHILLGSGLHGFGTGLDGGLHQAGDFTAQTFDFSLEAPPLRCSAFTFSQTRRAERSSQAG